MKVGSWKRRLIFRVSPNFCLVVKAKEEVEEMEGEKDELGWVDEEGGEDEEKEEDEKEHWWIIAAG